MGTIVPIADTENQQAIDNIRRQHVDDEAVATKDLVKIVAQLSIAIQPVRFAEALSWTLALAEAEATQIYARHFGVGVRPDLGVIAAFSPSGDQTPVTRVLGSRLAAAELSYGAAEFTAELRERVQFLEPGNVTLSTGHFRRIELNWSLVSGLFRVSRANSKPMLLYALAFGRTRSWG